MTFELARAIADAVLYEGYMLYPYRASSVKNRIRWQFGVLAPAGFSEAGGSESWDMQTEVLIEPHGVPLLDLRVRFLQLRVRTVEEMAGGEFVPVERLDIGEKSFVSWEEGAEQAIDHPGIAIADLLRSESVLPFEIAGFREVEELQEAGTLRGRVVHERWPVAGVLRLEAQAVSDLVKVRIRIENRSPWAIDAPLDRSLALRRSLVGTHTLLGLTGGLFVSLLDPPEGAGDAAASCQNVRTWPVLVGGEGARDVVLSSPIILYDYPAVAPESPGDLCDSTEIDEILTLRVMTLTEDEKKEARATDERARAIIDRSDLIPPEVMERLHGAIRGMGGPARPEIPAELSAWESFLNPPTSVSPHDASLQVGSHTVAKGSRVRLRPSRRADSMDVFLAGRVARVEGIYGDVDEQTHVAVTLEDDPARDLHGFVGRFFYFAPDELEPLEDENEAERRH